MKYPGLNLFLIISCIAMLLSCSGKKHSDNHSDQFNQSGQSDPYVVDSLAYERWGNPGSPFRNEERYISFLNEFLSDESLPGNLRMRAKERLRIASLNRPGSTAADFEFIDRNLRQGSLHTTTGERIMLIFYDPECPHCNDILSELAASVNLNEAIATGQMTVIAIYAEGKRDLWDSTKSDMPDNWQVGYDLTGILDRGLYDLPAMPVIYLLDSTCRVLLKDPDYRIFLTADD